MRSHNFIRTGLMRLQRLAIVRRIGLHTSRDACDTLTPSAGRRDNAPGDPRPASTTRDIQTKTSAAELVLLTGCSGPTCAASGGAGQWPSVLLSRTPWCAGIEPGSGSTCDGARVQAHAEGRRSPPRFKPWFAAWRKRIRSGVHPGSYTSMPIAIQPVDMLGTASLLVAVHHNIRTLKTCEHSPL